MPVPPSNPTRERILDAAARLMREVGLVRATTKEIARAADCSEALLYKYFAGKEALFLRVLAERLPPLGRLLAGMSAGPGSPPLEQCLTEIAAAAVRFYQGSFPIAASLLADPALLTRHRESLDRTGHGPRAHLHALSDYLRLERAEGRLRPDADPDAAAELLLGAAFQRAFFLTYAGAPADAGPAHEPPPGERRAGEGSTDAFALALARTVAAAVQPL